MAPKFRGNSDDWLDNETTSSRGRSRHKTPHLRASLDPQEANGTVVEVFSNQCRVAFDDGKVALCAYRRASVIGCNAEGLRERAPVAVGDRIRAKLEAVEGVCARRNQLFRPAPDREGRAVHVIAANLDLLIVVASARMPDFSPGLVDRFLIGAAVGGIEALLIVNKIDLVPPGTSESECFWKVYSNPDQGPGIETFEMSAKASIGVSALSERIKGKSVVFCGHSGVGKTSLLRALLGAPIGKVAAVSGVTGKGRHTTTGAVLLRGPENAQWIDTPGVREFGIAGVDADALSPYFKEFSLLECTQHGCLHLDEPDCQARSLPRYSSYQRIYSSLKAGES